MFDGVSLFLLVVAVAMFDGVGCISIGSCSSLSGNA